MRWLLDTAGALYELARLAWISRFNMRGAYWRWRWETAFGAGEPPRREIIRAALEYGRWVRRMRRQM